jgi:predicted DNA-binding transcriptional regulator AlpA
MIPRFLRFADLQAARIVESRAQLKNLIEREGFPAGLKLGANTRAWPEREVEKWLATRGDYPQAPRGVARRPRKADPAETAIT